MIKRRKNQKRGPHLRNRKKEKLEKLNKALQENLRVILQAGSPKVSLGLRFVCFFLVIFFFYLYSICSQTG